jgi:hypothetical protein
MKDLKRNYWSNGVMEKPEKNSQRSVLLLYQHSNPPCSFKMTGVAIREG